MFQICFELLLEKEYLKQQFSLFHRIICQHDLKNLFKIMSTIFYIKPDLEVSNRFFRLFKVMFKRFPQNCSSINFLQQITTLHLA